MIRAEIKHLNEEIDMKIIRGLTYRTEARRHKSLMAQLSRLTLRGELQRYEVRSEVKRVIHSAQLKWYQRPLGFASAFLF